MKVPYWVPPLLVLIAGISLAITAPTAINATADRLNPDEVSK